jgi:uncharacterized protein (TIGR00255 family)
MANIISMTGYGKGEYNDGKRVITAEIKTINNRYCDINIKTPRHLRFFEDNIKKILKKSIQRGRIDLYLNIDYISESDTAIVPNLCLANQYKKAIDEIKNELQLNTDISIDTIIKFQDVLISKEDNQDEEELKICVEKAVDDAVDNLISMRLKEGFELENDIRLSMDKILELIDEISKNSESIVNDYKLKLETRIKELLGNKYELDENRLYNEIVLSRNSDKKLKVFFKTNPFDLRFNVGNNVMYINKKAYNNIVEGKNKIIKNTLDAISNKSKSIKGKAFKSINDLRNIVFKRNKL